MADYEMLWPLRAVSEDPTNVTKLDADNKVLTSTTDIAAKFVQKAGDTMTGSLTLEYDGTAGANTILYARYANTGQPNINLRRTKGTKAAQTTLQAGDSIGQLIWTTINPSGGIIQCGRVSQSVTVAPTAQGGIGTEIQLVTAGTNPDGTILYNTAQLNEKGEFSSNRGRFIELSSDSVTAVSLQFQTASGTAGATCAFTSPVRIAPVAGATPNSLLVVNTSSGAATAGIFVDMSVAAATSTVGLYLHNGPPASPSNFAIYSTMPASSYLMGKLGAGTSSPTRQLEVVGDTMLRGPLEVTGNITSAGTAHSFAAGSIGSPAVIGNTPRTIAATGSAGSAGQMVWDDNFIYLRTTAGWKKVALTAI